MSSEAREELLGRGGLARNHEHVSSGVKLREEAARMQLEDVPERDLVGDASGCGEATRGVPDSGEADGGVPLDDIGAPQNKGHIVTDGEIG